MSKTALNDQDLLRSYLSGNAPALDNLIERHRKKVYMAILLKVNDRQLADDLFQDTFIRVVEKLQQGRYNEEGKFSSWVLCIAHNLCMDYFRKGKRNPVLQGTDISDIDRLGAVACDDAEKNEEEFSKMEREMLNMVNALPVEQREVVLLRMYHNLSFKEVAVKTKSNLSTCLGRMRYALLNLRKMMMIRGIHYPAW